MRPASQRHGAFLKNYVQPPNPGEPTAAYSAQDPEPMMRRTKSIVLLAALGLGQPAWGACTLPPPPSKVPDGNSATEPEMVAAMQTLKRYNTDVTNYVKCLEFEANQNRLSRDEQARQHNSAIDGLQAIAAKFNEQVRLFKSKKG
jgi:hypothetical protein